MDFTTIELSARDINVDWLHKSVPRFFNFEAASILIAAVTHCKSTWFSLKTKIITIGSQSTEVIQIHVAKEKASAFSEALLKAVETGATKPYDETLSLMFITSMLPAENQAAAVFTHNEYLATIDYVWIENIASIDMENRFSLSIQQTTIQ